MIDVDLRLHVQDRTRRFDLDVRFATDVAFAALYGPSGSGKTLTLQAIAGLLHPNAGHVRLDGRTLYDSARGIDLPPHDRRIGYLFQDYALFPHLSVQQNIEFGLTSWRRKSLSSHDRQRVRTLMESFELTPLASSRPATLSGGQRQRVALARALACEPQVLLLDEPFASLNPLLRQSLRHELALARRQWGIPALMITHDIEDAIELADVTFVYGAGRVVREIDMRDATARESAMREIQDTSPVAETTLRRRLRALLSGGR